MKNNRKRILSAFFCIVLILTVSLPSSAEPSQYVELQNRTVDLASLLFYSKPGDGQLEYIDGYFNELLELYLEVNYYGLDRNEALSMMLRRFLLDYPQIYPYLANSLLTAMDIYGGYYPNTETDNLLDANMYQGFGFYLGSKEYIEGYGYGVYITEVFNISPAFEAGVRAGDKILKVNGINVGNLGQMAVSNLLDSITSELNLTVSRNGVILEFVFARGLAYLPPYSIEILDNQTKSAYIKLDNFLDYYMSEALRIELSNLYEQGCRDIIFDVRDNPGGNLLTVLETVDLFTTEKINLCGLIFRDETVDIQSSGTGFNFKNITILTNHNSASAAEYFAIAMREITGAVIIGTTTLGKGIGQGYYALSNGAVAGITELEITSPNGELYHGKGVVPDINIDTVYKYFENTNFDQLNFVNCVNIKPGADNKAVLALNQRLARIGYLNPDKISSICTEDTINAVKVLQSIYGLPVGEQYINYMFLLALDNHVYYYSYGIYIDTDVQMECAKINLTKGFAEAEKYAKNID